MSVRAQIVPFVTYRVTIQFLSPVHVGSGQILDPYGYVLRSDGARYWLGIFDQGAVFSDLPDDRRAEFLKLCDRGDHVGLRRFFQQMVKPEHVRWQVEVDKPTFLEIQKNINNPNSMGEIHLFTRDPQSGAPYLPGSSIKGAIRTAIIDQVLQRLDNPRKGELHGKFQMSGGKRSGAQFEAEVLGHLNNDGRPDLYRDPFKQLAVADAPIPPEVMQIRRVQIVTRNRQTQGAEKILMYRDVVYPVLRKEPVFVETEVRWHKRFLSNVIRENQRVPREITPADICRACNEFYRRRYQEELKKFPLSSAGLVIEPPAETDGGCLLRLGRHSHFECMTVNSPFSQPPPRGVGRSRTRVEGKIPLGWVYLEFQEKVQ